MILEIQDIGYDNIGYDNMGYDNKGNDNKGSQITINNKDKESAILKLPNIYHDLLYKCFYLHSVTLASW